MTKSVAILLIVSVLTLPTTAFAAFGSQFEQIELHMTTQQVESLLGKPSAQEKHGEYLIWTYLQRLITVHGDHRSDYFVVFKRDKVLDYGVGNVRASEKGGVITIVPTH